MHRGPFRLAATPSPFPIIIEELSDQYLSTVLQMDQECFGGLWTKEGYLREIDSPNSQILIIKAADSDADTEHANLEQREALLHSAEPLPYATLNNLNNKNQIIGIACVWFILEEAHITMLAIRQPYRRQGLGQFLLLTLLENAIHRQSKWATLEVRLSNQAAQTLYEKFGFINIGQRKKYYQDTGEDALILWNKGLQNQAFHHDLEQLKKHTIEQLREKGWNITKSPILHGDKSR